MLAITWLAIEIPRAFTGPGGAAFAGAYVAVRAILIALYLRADHHEPRARPLTRRFLAAFIIGAALWLASAFVSPPARYVLWAAGALIELAAPALSVGAIRRVPFHTSHISERYGAFTIIVLGETVALVATGMAASHLQAHTVVTAVFCFVIAACLWWLYFDFVNSSPLTRGPLASQTYSYGHVLISAGITASGVGALLAIRASAQHSLTAAGRWALCGGAALFLIAIATIHLIDGWRWRDRQVWSRSTLAAALAELSGEGAVLSPRALTIAAAVLLITSVLAEAALPRSAEAHEATGG